MLLTDEQYVIKWLSQYGPLPKTQVVLLLRNKSPATVELFRQHRYEVKLFNLVNQEHGNLWNCMGDLGGDTLLAQVLTNVIIGNTSSGKTDHFWDNGEGNLLTALILYVNLDPSHSPKEQNRPVVYGMLISHSAAQFTTIAQADSENVWAGWPLSE